jgi:opacity protein-like surface antigen
MNRSVLAGIVALVLINSVDARAQAPSASWTGFYLGGHAGYQSAHANVTTPSGAFPVTLPPCCAFAFPAFNSNAGLTMNSAVGGVLAGYNVQPAAWLLLGVEADATWGGRRGSAAFSFFDPVSGGTGSFALQTRIDWSASLRARLGIVQGPWLFYATSGISFVRIGLSGAGSSSAVIDICGDGCLATANTLVNFSFSKTQPGLVVGGGIERLLAAGWILRLEYLFADYGKIDFGDVAVVSSYFNGFGCGCTVTAVSTGRPTEGLSTSSLRFAISKKIP